MLIVAGGLGLPPLRPLIEQVLAQRGRFRDVRIVIGARTPDDLVLRADTAAWLARDDVSVGVTVDRADTTWSGPVGVVTQLFDRAPIDPIRTVAYLCGPERMMQAASRVLAGRGVLPDRILVSMERHMECGVGLCGHCQMGASFVCRDGPVFSRAELGDAFVAVTSCGKVEPDKHSETALTIAIRASEAIYTIQWAERAPANAENLTIDESKCKNRLKQMVPFRICPIVAGEKAPYPSCGK